MGKQIENVELKAAFEEVKTLVMIGGLPALAFIISMIVAHWMYSDLTAQLTLIAWCVGPATVLAIAITVFRMFRMLKNIGTK